MKLVFEGGATTTHERNEANNFSIVMLLGVSLID